MMKKEKCYALVLALAILALTLTACGRSTFGVTENTGKRMTITAERADKDAFFMLGTLEVDEGEQLAINANLTKGAIRVEIIAADAEQSIDKLPNMDSEPALTANLKATESTSGTLSAGSYLLRATCLEKATGTVQIEVSSAA